MESTLERVRSRGTHIVQAPAADEARTRSAIELIARGLLVGAGTGAILMAGAHNQLLIVVFAGVLAIGAAIAELGA